MGVAAGGEVLVGVGASVVLIAVFVSVGAMVRFGVADGPPGGAVVGMGVWDGNTTVCMGVVCWPVGEAVSLGVGVSVWLGVMVEDRVGIPEAVAVVVKVKAASVWQALTPAKPRLYASNTLKYRKPTSRSLSET